METSGWKLSDKQRELIMGPISKKVITGQKKAKSQKDRIKTYESFMKYGKNKYFWN